MSCTATARASYNGYRPDVSDVFRAAIRIALDPSHEALRLRSTDFAGTSNQLSNRPVVKRAARS
jgi:hypothetical protein